MVKGSPFILSAAALAVFSATNACQILASIQDLPGPPADSGSLGSDDGGTAIGADGQPTTPPAPLSKYPSCASLPATCGANGATDCCDSPVIPAGSYYRDYDAIDFTLSSYRGTVSSFRLDRFEATVGRFRSFVAAFAGGWRPTITTGSGGGGGGGGGGWGGHSGGGFNGDAAKQLPADGMALEANLECHSTFQTYTRTPGNNDVRPINCVTWAVAAAFCIWDGGRLPTDNEWNYVAAGGDEQRYYPFGGSKIDPSQSSYFVDQNKQCYGDRVSGCTIQDFTLVGSHPAGDAKWGQADMSGNVAEWVADGDADKGATCVDCVDGTNNDGARRVRGGSYNTGAPGTLRVADYFTADPGTPSERIGVRCARGL